MSHKFLLITFIVVSLSGCATALTSQGGQVKIVNKDPRGCQYIGEVSIYTKAFFGMDVFDAEGAAKKDRATKVRNTVGKLGGNQAVWLSHQDQINIWFDQYAAYKCQTS